MAFSLKDQLANLRGLFTKVQPVEREHDAEHEEIHRKERIKKIAKGRIRHHDKPRTRLQKNLDHFIQALASANAFLMFFILLGLGIGAFVRYGALTDNGRQAIVSMADGMKLPLIGHLRVSGLRGDFFTEFDLEHAAIVDDKGTWIEGDDFHVKWDSLALVHRQFHLIDARAKLIKIYRRPNIPPRTGHLARFPVSLRIEFAQFGAETFEEFSVKHGVWGVAGDMNLKHNKDININFNVISSKRRSDGAKVVFAMKDGVPINSDIEAREAQGGALAGMLGLNVNQPLLLNIKLRFGNKNGLLNIFGTSGSQKFVDIKGNWNDMGGGFAGNANLNASKFTDKFAKRLGDYIKLSANWHPTNNPNNLASKITQIFKNRLGLNNHYDFLNFKLEGNNTKAEVSGIVDFKDRRSVNPLDFNLSFQNANSLLPTSAIGVNNANLSGKLSGNIKDWVLTTSAQISKLTFPIVAYQTASGPFNIKHKDGVSDIDFELNAAQGSGDNLLATVLGANSSLKAKLSHRNGGSWIIDNAQINGRAIDFKMAGGQNLFGAANMSGDAKIDLARLNDPSLKGTIDGNLILHQSNQSGASSLQIDARGQNLYLKSSNFDNFLGARPLLNLVIGFNGDGARISSLNFKGNDFELIGQSTNRPNAAIVLSGGAKIGDNFLKTYGINGKASGNWGYAAKDAQSVPHISFSLDGENISSKSAALSHVLGDKPKAQALINFVNGGVNIANAQILGDGARFTGNGLISYASGYNVDLGWLMNGPLYFGPVQLDGNLTGNGKLSGPINQPIVELNARINQLNLGPAQIKPAILTTRLEFKPSGLDSTLNLHGQTEYGDIEGSAAIINPNGGIELRNIDIHGAGINATGNARFIENENPSADLNVQIGHGAFLQSGAIGGRIRLSQTQDDTLANIALEGNNFVFRNNDYRFSKLKISGSGPLSNLNLQTSFATISPLNTKFDGITNIRGNHGEYDIALNGSGLFGNRNFRIDEPINILMKDNGQSAKGKIIFTGSQAQDQGLVDFDAKKHGLDFNLTAQVRDFSLALVHRDFLGAFSGNINLEGSGAVLSGRMNGALNNAHARGLGNDMALSGNIDAKLDNNLINLKLDATNPQGLNLNLDAILPAVASAYPLRLKIDRTKPINGHYSAIGEVRPLADIVFAGERILGGHIDAAGQIQGSINNPAFIGRFKLENGNFREPTIGLNLGALNVSGTTDIDKIKIDNFSANDGHNGSVSGEGEIRTGAQENSILHINTRRFKLVDTDTAKISATSNVILERRIGQVSKLTGDVVIDFAEFSPRALSGNNIINMDVEEIHTESRPIAAMPAPRAQNINNDNASNLAVALDVNLSAPRGVFVRGSGLNLELSLDAKLKGALNAPQLTGLARVYRGEYEYGGRTFAFDESGTITLAANPANIRLNLMAERKTTSLTAKIEVTGTAVAPKVRLTSAPELPTDEILSQVLFGRSRAQLSTLETVQLAASLASLASGGGFDVMSNLRQITRLDRLVFTNTASGQVSVAGGKYLGKDVFLEIISEGTQGVSTNVEWRPNSSTAIASQVGSTGDAKISIRWRRDFR